VGRGEAAFHGRLPPLPPPATPTTPPHVFPATADVTATRGWAGGRAGRAGGPPILVLNAIPPTSLYYANSSWHAVAPSHFCVPAHRARLSRPPPPAALPHAAHTTRTPHTTPTHTALRFSHLHPRPRTLPAPLPHAHPLRPHCGAHPPGCHGRDSLQDGQDSHTHHWALRLHALALHLHCTSLPPTCPPRGRAAFHHTCLHPTSARKRLLT